MMNITRMIQNAKCNADRWKYYQALRKMIQEGERVPRAANITSGKGKHVRGAQPVRGAVREAGKADRT